MKVNALSAVLFYSLIIISPYSYSSEYKIQSYLYISHIKKSSPNNINNSKDIIVQNTLLSSWTIHNFYENDSIVPPIDNSVINLEFSDDRKSFSGFAGCNRIRGNLYISTNTNEINFNEIISTKAFCAFQQQEDKFINLLENVNNYKVEDEELFLIENNKIIMSFVLTK